MNNPALTEAARWADVLMDAESRGRKDREGPIRYRLARKIGVPESYLFRLQYKTNEMTDVRGSVYRALMLAYREFEEAGSRAYAAERELADARNSKVAGLAAAVAGPQNPRIVNDVEDH